MSTDKELRAGEHDPREVSRSIAVPDTLSAHFIYPCSLLLVNDRTVTHGTEHTPQLFSAFRRDHRDLQNPISGITLRKASMGTPDCKAASREFDSLRVPVFAYPRLLRTGAPALKSSLGVMCVENRLGEAENRNDLCMKHCHV